MSKNYWKISSALKATTGFSFRKDGKNVKVQIPGKYRLNDKNLPQVYIADETYKELRKSGHQGATSPFDVLLDKGINGGIVAEKVKFIDLSEEWQKYFDPEEFEKLQLKKRQQAEKELEKAE